MRKFLYLFIILSALLFSPRAYALRKIDPNGIKLPQSYKAEAVVANLTVPTTAIFDNDDLIVAESGEANTGKPRILRITPSGKVSLIVSDGLIPPVTGLLMVDGKLFVSHRTKVSVVEGGKLHDIVTDLPSNGDHQNNKIVLGPDHKIYMGQGTVTNSAVVGVDNYLFGWLPQYPEAHDIPCRDIKLTGQNFQSDNPLSGGSVTTGPYHAFGQQSSLRETIKGETKCNGSILRFNPDGSGLEMYAWGFRNPFGLSFDSSGQLWTNYHGADVRGSRPIFNDSDYLVKVEKNGWYGWPEYFNGQPVGNGSFDAPLEPAPKFIWTDHPKLSKAFTTYAPHSAANGLAFSPGGEFGFSGDAFSALFGTFTTPTAGVNIAPAGFRVSRVDIKTGKVYDFASNKIAGPSYINQGGGFDRPSDVLFAKDGSLYVVDFGGTNLQAKGLEFTPQSGVVWRIYKETQKAIAPNGPILVSSAAIPLDERAPLVTLGPQLLKTQAPHLLILLIPLIIVIVLIAWFIKRLRK